MGKWDEIWKINESYAFLVLKNDKSRLRKGAEAIPIVKGWSTDLGVIKIAIGPIWIKIQIAGCFD